MSRIKEPFKAAFRGASSSLTYVLNQDHINNLIQAAKQIESSLHHALSTIL
jgi:hypothetical protein